MSKGGFVEESVAPVLMFSLPIFHAGLNMSMRRGTKWHGVPKAHIHLGDGELCGPVTLVTRTAVFADLTDEDFRHQHNPAHRSKMGMFLEMQRLYDGFEEDETVTLVFFQLPSGCVRSPIFSNECPSCGRNWREHRIGYSASGCPMRLRT